MARARHRADRPGGVEPLPVRRQPRQLRARRQPRRGAHRHRRARHDPRGGEELPRRRHPHPPVAVPAGGRRAEGRRRAVRRDQAPARPHRLRPHRRLRRRHRRRGSTSVAGDPLPPTIHLALERVQDLRYGENPHQTGARYREVGTTSWWDGVEQHGGMALSYLNLFDADAAWGLANDLATTFGQPAVAIIKHANPCGAAIAADAARRLPARLRVRRALGLRWHRGAVAPGRRRHGRAHGRRRAGRRRDRARLRRRRDRGAGQEAQEHPAAHRHASGPRPAPDPPAHRLVARAGRPPLRVDPRRLAGRHQARADARPSGPTPSWPGAWSAG